MSLVHSSGKHTCVNMSLKLLVLVAASLAHALPLPADGQCKCNTDVDNKDLWAHLANISKKIDETTDKSSYAVLPAVLSPLVSCDCDKIRQKRKIMPDVPDHKETKPQKVYIPKTPIKSTPIRRGTPACPQDYVKVGYRCVREDDDVLD